MVNYRKIVALLGVEVLGIQDWNWWRRCYEER